MARLHRTRRQRALQFDNLENKTLLSTVTVYPFGHPDAAHKVHVAATGGSSNGTSGNSGTRGIIRRRSVLGLDIRQLLGDR